MNTNEPQNELTADQLSLALAHLSKRGGERIKAWMDGEIFLDEPDKEIEDCYDSWRDNDQPSAPMWDDVPEKTRDQMRDAYLSGVDGFFRQRLANATETVSPVSSGESGVIELGLVKEIVDVLEWAVIHMTYFSKTLDEASKSWVDTTLKKSTEVLSRLRSVPQRGADPSGVIPLGGPEGVRPPVPGLVTSSAHVPPVGRFTHETVASPGWYWFKSDYPGKGFSDRFVLLEEDSFEDGNKWLKGRNCQGTYFGPIDMEALTASPTVPVLPPVGGEE